MQRYDIDRVPVELRKREYEDRPLFRQIHAQEKAESELRTSSPWTQGLPGRIYAAGWNVFPRICAASTR